MSWLDTTVAVFQDAERSVGNLVSMRQVVETVRTGDAILQRVLAVREVYAAKPYAEAKAETDAIKRKLPAITVCGDYTHLRKSGHCARYTGFVIVDIDHTTGMAHSSEVVRHLSADPACAFAMVSPSGCGVKAIYCTDATRESDHRSAWETVRDRVRRRIGLDIDPSGCDASRLCFLSFAPDCHVREDPEVVHVTPAAPAATPAAVTPANAPERVPEGMRHAWLVRRACQLRRLGCDQPSILAHLVEVAPRMLDGAKPAHELRAIATWAAARPDAHEDTMTEVQAARIAQGLFADDADDGDGIVDAVDLASEGRILRAPIIHGILRAGETMNISAAPKSGKSWLALNLAVSLSSGAPWLGYTCEPSRVLYIDNELHGETYAHRLRMVVQARHLDPQRMADRYRTRFLRGRQCDIHAILASLRAMHERGGWLPQVVVLDALYRFFPDGMDENSNTHMVAIYNAIDRVAMDLGIAFIIIHHTSKGSQAGKAITDVGAGAGAQSRAPDAHMIIRPHANPGMLSVHAVTRSWPDGVAIVIRKELPLFFEAVGENPDELERPDGGRDAAPMASDTLCDHIMAAVRSSPVVTIGSICESMRAHGVARVRVNDAVQMLVAQGQLHRHPRHRIGLSPYSPDAGPDITRRILAADPAISSRELARELGISHTSVARIRADANRKEHHEEDA